ncbi:hypothetical protein BOX15_Mlig009395g1 [Macrostomum lignano]|uniref:Uncharacterized protein n=1 Tax=Macrostomum lignano TaxID=282301 RepID=A0A267DNC3_9PLAT|nr:hypothetical protein BOX15_Mlig009395g4 [Macrostomum lignano]PAA50705.1 hypothetical protein BOX15_Mlig009395g2 [Macrostomum lignano]PAA54337.1 hypothetical protein BOX15_Mlig009395g1 [Macrostomum lignano]
MAVAGKENSQLFGVWKAYKSENMAALMEKAGAPWMARKMGANATPTVTMTRLDDRRISISSKTMMFNMEQVHELDTLVQGDMAMAGKQVEYYTEWTDDGKLVVYQADVGAGGDLKTTGMKTVRSLEPNGEMLVTVSMDNVVAYRWFKRQT